MMKYFITRGLQSNKYDTQLHMQLAARREFVMQTPQCILTKKKYLESYSARNNIHPNSKQKPKITNKTTEK